MLNQPNVALHLAGGADGCRAVAHNTRLAKVFQAALGLVGRQLGRQAELAHLEGLARGHLLLLLMLLLLLAAGKAAHKMPVRGRGHASGGGGRRLALAAADHHQPGGAGGSGGEWWQGCSPKNGGCCRWGLHWRRRFTSAVEDGGQRIGGRGGGRLLLGHCVSDEILLKRGAIEEGTGYANWGTRKFCNSGNGRCWEFVHGKCRMIVRTKV
jgi:hypothetical protein